MTKHKKNLKNMTKHEKITKSDRCEKTIQDVASVKNVTSERQCERYKKNVTSLAKIAERDKMCQV